MKHKHKSGAFFELPEDITQRQLEIYEGELRRTIKDNELVTDALLGRTAVAAAIKAEIVTASEGLPKSEKELRDAPASLLWWMAHTISEFVGGLKRTDPN